MEGIIIIDIIGVGGIAVVVPQLAFRFSTLAAATLTALPYINISILYIPKEVVR